jgi:hypothetical protein
MEEDTRKGTRMRRTWKQRLALPWSLAGLVVVGVAAFAFAALVILDEEDPPAEAAGYHNCHVDISNDTSYDLNLTSMDPDDDDAWGTGNPPQTIEGNSSATVDFKFLSNSKPRSAQLVYGSTPNQYGAHLEVTMQWACKDETFGTQAETSVHCFTNSSGAVDCNTEQEGYQSTTKQWRFRIYEDFPGA